MKSIRLFATTATLLAASVLCAGSLQAQEHGHERGERGREHAQAAPPQPLPPQEQQRRINEARERDQQYRARLNQQMAAEQQRAAQLQQANRRAQYEAQQRYLANLRAQQQRLQAERDYDHDQRLLSPYAYRYRRAGTYYETTDYGAQVLRQAVQYGYQEGYRAGVADRDDRARFDYRDNFAYQDANYGYSGAYVADVDYNYYFREGFRRGYEDGYYARYRYGSLLNGAPSILAGVLGSILGLIPIR